MRDPAPVSPRLAVALIWVLGACFVVQSVLAFHGRVDVSGMLGLSRGALWEGRVWTLVTYQFLHAVPLPFHVLANALGLFFFGRAVEEHLGWRRFLGIYLVGGVLGGLAQVLLGGLFGRFGTVVGASAGVCAVAATYCRLFPDRRVMFSLYLLPIEMRASILLWVLVAYDGWCAVFPADGVAHLAHLGGYGVGFLAVRWLNSAGDGLSDAWKRLLRPKPRLRMVTDDEVPSRRRPREPRATTAPSDWSREIDPILDKIAAQGIQSLTEAERSALERARRRMGGGV